MTAWTAAFPLSELALGGARLFRAEDLQVAVLRDEDGALFAVDNLCPHEGYPLVQGRRSGCTLTCAWHNWRFDLRDGGNLKGGEAVRVFPVRVVDGQVQLDLSPPDPAREQARLWTSLTEALDEHQTGRAARDATRLLLAGVSAAQIAAFAAAFDGDRASYGATHALPVSADVLRFCQGGPRDAVALAQALDLASFNNARRPLRVRAVPEDPGDDPVAASRLLAARVEAEDALGAEALLLGALARGWRRAELEPCFYSLCAAHFLSFGHSLIYQAKVFDLLDAADWVHADSILCGHLFGIICATREDVLPAWRPWHKRLATVDLPALWAVPVDPSWADRDAVVDALVGGRAVEALDRMLTAMAAGAGAAALCDAVSLAAAERMLRFDRSHDANQAVQDNWLSVSHILTFAAAVRTAVGRWQDPQVLRLLLQGVRFVNHHKVLDGPQNALSPQIIPQVGTTAQLLDAIMAKDTDLALALAAAEPVGMDAALISLGLSDLAGAPIVAAHVLKTVLVGVDEAAVIGDPRPRLAVVRLLASPLQQRWVQRGALEAVAFVTTGRKPRVLAP